MKATPLPVMRIEIAAAWVQSGTRAARISVTDCRRLRMDECPEWQELPERCMCQVIEYVEYTRQNVGKARWPRKAWIESNVQALTWFNKTVERISKRL